jgi:peptidoglycan L-alanyl-D-glutamate endopeptidase CwlK
MLSDLSKKRLATCEPEIVRVVEAAAADIPLLVVWGARSKIEQEEAVRTGHSKLHWPKSAHNVTPARPLSRAVDLAPLKPDGTIDWNDRAGFVRLARVVKAAAEKLGIEVEWGGDWRMADLDHFQLEEHAT